MFDPAWDDGCPSCTAGTDEISPGFLEHLHTRDTTYALVSRAPLAKLERWKRFGPPAVKQFHVIRQIINLIDEPAEGTSA